MISLPSGVKIVSEEKNQGVYDVEGLYPGYGQTVGNSMRRVLLSSLQGAAITAAKIKGVSHEFSTVEGVLEDVVELILNLKQVRFKLLSEGPHSATISVKGEKEVLAKDIKTSGGVEVVNGDLHIATLTSKGAELSMDIEISAGFGYQPIESQKKEKVDIGMIALDAAFSPVRLVNFEVENMRVGDRTDYNKVRFTIETDSSITPRNAFIQAAKILVDQFSALGTILEPDEAMPLFTASKEKEKVLTDDGSYEEKFLHTNVEELKLSTRTQHALENAHLETVSDLVEKTEKEIREDVRGLGDKGIVEIKKALGNLGLTFRQ